MTGSRGPVAGIICAATLLIMQISGNAAAGTDDVKACAAVGSAAVRLACFDAAAGDVAEGDIAACSKVGSDTVRLACFDAASGRSASPAGGAAPPPAAGSSATLGQEEVNAREAALQARIEELQRKAAEVERRAAEVERKTAEVNRKNAAGTFGDPKAESKDPLTAETYGKATREDEEESSDKIKRIAVKITGIEKGPFGKLKVTLANGQVWKQIDSSRAYWSEDAENTAHIKRAWMGSFLMRINDEGATIRVRRVK